MSFLWSDSGMLLSPVQWYQTSVTCQTQDIKPLKQARSKYDHSTALLQHHQVPAGVYGLCSSDSRWLQILNMMAFIMFTVTVVQLFPLNLESWYHKGYSSYIVHVMLI